MKIFTLEKIKTEGVEIPAVCVEKRDCKPYSLVSEQKMGKNVNVCLYENRMGYPSYEIYPIPPLVNRVKERIK
jgi:hypothetical protein